jgi:polysaccharide pyruvyl transferase WcaK-like protein
LSPSFGSKKFPKIRPNENGQRPFRIGLVSPYSGGNLGNGAINDAVIANIRRRVPGVEIIGFTLNPEDTRCRHGIKAFPLAAVSRPYYLLFNSTPSNRSEGRPASGSQDSRSRIIKTWLKRIPLLRPCVRAFRNLVSEAAHTIRAAREVRSLDMVMVPGGGALDDTWGGPWGHPWSLFKWSALCRYSAVPFLFVSVGKCAVKKRLSRFFVRKSLGRAAYRSYRDAESKLAVQSLIGACSDPVFPDLAFSYPQAKIQSESAEIADSYRLGIGFSPIAYRDPRAWPTADNNYYAAYVRRMSEVVKWLHERHDLFFFSTDSPDASVIKDIQDELNRTGARDISIPSVIAPPQQTVAGLLRGIAPAQLVIASRLHGVILAHFQRIPVLALSFDPKVESHMRAIGHEDYCLKLDDFQFGTFVERFEVLKRNLHREQTHLASVVAAYSQSLDLQYNAMLGLPNADSLHNASDAPVDALSVS